VTSDSSATQVRANLKSHEVVAPETKFQLLSVFKIFKTSSLLDTLELSVSILSTHPSWSNQEWQIWETGLFWWTWIKIV